MTDQKIDPVPPTLAARLSEANGRITRNIAHACMLPEAERRAVTIALEDVRAALMPEWETQHVERPSDWPTQRDRGQERAPEPVTPPVAAPAGSFVDVAARVRQQIENEPDDDGRGLAVDMIDVDRLLEMARQLPTDLHRMALDSFARRLATQITETLSLRAEVQADDALLANYRRTIACIPPCSQHGDDCLPHAEDWIKCRQADESELAALRQSLREAEQERDALRTALKKMRLPLYSTTEACPLCGNDWPWDYPPNHKPDCLLAEAK